MKDWVLALASTRKTTAPAWFKCFLSPSLSLWWPGKSRTVIVLPSNDTLSLFGDWEVTVETKESTLSLKVRGLLMLRIYPSQQSSLSHVTIAQYKHILTPLLCSGCMTTMVCWFGFQTRHQNCRSLVEEAFIQTRCDGECTQYWQQYQWCNGESSQVRQ